MKTRLLHGVVLSSSMLLVLGSTSLANESESAGAVVAADGSGDYTSIQRAIYAAPFRPTGPPWVIHVKPGVYEERVYVQRERGNLRLVGEDPDTTILTNNLHANMPGPDGEPIGTFRTPTLQIDGDGFEIENLTIENSAGPVGQALALRADGDRLVFTNCRFLGWQDTIFLNRGRSCFTDCVIKGHVDFIFGGGTAWFENCDIHCLKNGYITAASTPEDERFGLIFNRCRITGEPGVKTYLGRPWRSYGMTAFLNCEMSEVVRPEGWHNWGKTANEQTARYQEHGNSGPGAELEGRVAWLKKLSTAEAEELTLETTLKGKDNWNPLNTSSETPAGGS